MLFRPELQLFARSKDDAALTLAPRVEDSHGQVHKTAGKPGYTQTVRKAEHFSSAYNSLDLAEASVSSATSSRYKTASGHDKPVFSPAKLWRFSSESSVAPPTPVYPMPLVGHDPSQLPARGFDHRNIFEPVSRRKISRGPYQNHDLLVHADGMFVILESPVRFGRDSTVHMGILGHINQPGLAFLAAVKRITHAGARQDPRGVSIAASQQVRPRPAARFAEERTRRDSIVYERLLAREINSSLAPWRTFFEVQNGQAQQVYYSISDLAHNDLGQALDAHRPINLTQFSASTAGIHPTNFARAQIRSDLFVGAFYRLVELARILNSLHTNANGEGSSISHNDLKCANLLIDNRFELVLADLEFSTYIKGQLQPVFGRSIKYSPPEILLPRGDNGQDRPYHHMFYSDMWAMAFIVPQLLLVGLPNELTTAPLEMRPSYSLFRPDMNSIEQVYRQVADPIKALRHRSFAKALPEKRRQFERIWQERDPRTNNIRLTDEERQVLERLRRDGHLSRHLEAKWNEFVEEVIENWLPETSEDRTHTLISRLVHLRAGLQWARHAFIHELREIEKDTQSRVTWAHEVKNEWTDYRKKLLQWEKEESFLVSQGQQTTLASHPLPSLSAMANRFIYLSTFERMAALDQAFGWGPRFMELMTGLLHPETHAHARFSTQQVRQHLFKMKADILLGRLPQNAVGSTVVGSSLLPVEDAELMRLWSLEYARISTWVKAQVSNLHDGFRRHLTLDEYDLFAIPKHSALKHVVAALRKLVTFDNQLGGELAHFKTEWAQLNPAKTHAVADLASRLRKIDDRRHHPLLQDDSPDLAYRLLQSPGPLASRAVQLQTKGIPDPHAALLKDVFSAKPPAPLAQRRPAPTHLSLFDSWSTVTPTRLSHRRASEAPSLSANSSRSTPSEGSSSHSRFSPKTESLMLPESVAAKASRIIAGGSALSPPSSTRFGSLPRVQE